MPILYVKPPEFSSDNLDNAVSLVASTQYVDWQDLRLIEPNSREFRKAVNELAKRLWQISNSVAERQLREEMSDDDSRSGSADGVADLVDRIMGLLPDWLESVINDQVMLGQMQATWRACLARVRKLERSKSPASAILGAQIRTAREMMPLLQRYNQAAKIYLERSIQLDPHVTALARLLRNHHENFELANPIRESVDEALENINKKMTIRSGDDDSNPGVGMNDQLRSWMHFGRIFQESIAISTKAQRAVQEGNEIVMRWDAELQRPATGGAKATSGISEARVIGPKESS